MGASTSASQGEGECYVEQAEQYSSSEAFAGASEDQPVVLQPEAILQQGASGQYTPEEYALYCEQYYAWYGVDPPDAPTSQPQTQLEVPNTSDRAGKDVESGEAALALIACYGSDSD